MFTPKNLHLLLKAATSNSSNVELTSNQVQKPAENSTIAEKLEQAPGGPAKEWADRLDSISRKARLPRSVQAVYLRPLRKQAEYGVPVCDLQLRSYSVRNVEFFADFALRAAYYLKLPVSGPVPLPRITERWTFPRSNFVHKKSQENFERITLRRLLQVKDGDPHVVQIWLSFLRKHAFYGVGMKANVWEHESLDVVKDMDKHVPAIEQSLDSHLSGFGQRDKEGHLKISDFLGDQKLTRTGPLTEVRGR
ncbi:Tryptophan--tRNA ligase, mitochondrial [Aspergillus melleus]|uniref:Tryptophan--tRNA ligase, mitochondrial n=1 Tax=Aspergillus melleus TaxID=138277 RepID=A0ACC3BGH2_9EURO|nr:Tryptophan--tRNA ligase, mitochondrial [Aspergillus melleus]